MKNKNISFMTQAAMIAAIYVVLTYVFAPFSFGEVQVRISEALTILPVFTPAAIPGLFIGCLIGNFLGGAILPDIIFGSICNINWSILYMEASREESLPCPGSTDYCKYPDRSVVLRYGYGVALPIPFMMCTVGIGEIISCAVLGMVLYFALKKYAKTLFAQ